MMGALQQEYRGILGIFTGVRVCCIQKRGVCTAEFDMNNHIRRKEIESNEKM